METKAKLKQFITRELIGRPDFALADDDDLLLNGLVDSLGVVRLLAFIETDLGTPVPPGDVTIENFGTVGSIAGFLQQLRPA